MCSCILNYTNDSTPIQSSRRRWRLHTLLGIEHSEKPRVFEQVFAGSRINSLGYWLEIFFSSGIATFGLVENSPAVIIGAMLISPLMSPIMATGMALALGDLFLGINAVLTLVASVSVTVVFSGFLVRLLPFHSATSEIVARTNPNLLDLGIALLSGLAGSVAVSKGAVKGATALPGVAIAVALMPPVCTMGFGLGSGLNLEIMGGAGLLFLTNLVAIVASAFLVFSLVGLDTPEVQAVAAASRKNKWLARALARGPLSSLLTTGGRLRWRILMILILLGSIAIPLRRALTQVANETIARGIVQEQLRRLAPSNVLLSQQTTIGKDEIVIRLIVTRAVAGARIAEVRRELARRTGLKIELSIVAVASQSELSDAMQHLGQPAPPPLPAPERSLAVMEKAFVDRIRPAVLDVWPSTDAPILDFAVTLGDDGVAVNLNYQGTRDLDPVAVNLVLNSLRTKLALPNLVLKTQRTRPPATTGKTLRR